MSQILWPESFDQRILEFCQKMVLNRKMKGQAWLMRRHCKCTAVRKPVVDSVSQAYFAQHWGVGCNSLSVILRVCMSEVRAGDCGSVLQLREACGFKNG